MMRSPLSRSDGTRRSVCRRGVRLCACRAPSGRTAPDFLLPLRLFRAHLELSAPLNRKHVADGRPVLSLRSRDQRRVGAAVDVLEPTPPSAKDSTESVPSSRAATDE